MAKKNKSLKMPKRVAGIKMSKRTRKNLGSVVGLLGRPEAKALMGSVVAALAGAIAGKREGRHDQPARRAAK